MSEFVQSSSIRLDNSDLTLIEQALQTQMNQSLRRFSSYSDSGIGIPGNPQEIRSLLGKIEQQKSLSI